MLFGARVLNVEEETYKYEKGESKKESCKDGLELELSL